MKKRIIVVLFVTHAAVGMIGFAAGIYLLPILIAPPAPTEAEIESASAQAQFTGEFTRDLKGSDGLHWGEGVLSVGSDVITFMGELSPGPDYQLYLSPEFVETEEDFNRIKESMVQVGAVRTFKNFVVDVPVDVNPGNFTSAIVWCESFGEFITSTKYQ